MRNGHPTQARVGVHERLKVEVTAITQIEVN